MVVSLSTVIHAIGKIRSLRPKDLAVFGLGALLCAQGFALLLVEGLYLVQIAQEVSAPGYSYRTMLGREVDLEFLSAGLALMPEDARVLSLVEKNAARPFHAALPYYLYPRYAVILDRDDQTDDRLAAYVVERQLTHIMVWYPAAYEASPLLQDSRYFEAHAYGQGLLILVVKSAPPLPDD
jgi:hypothetical protein